MTFITRTIYRIQQKRRNLGKLRGGEISKKMQDGSEGRKWKEWMLRVQRVRQTTKGIESARRETTKVKEEKMINDNRKDIKEKGKYCNTKKK